MWIQILDTSSRGGSQVHVQIDGTDRFLKVRHGILKPSRYETGAMDLSIPGPVGLDLFQSAAPIAFVEADGFSENCMAVHLIVFGDSLKSIKYDELLADDIRRQAELGCAASFVTAGFDDA